MLRVQEWLWCETWCGNSTKEYAKTIDLCNNPLTKEPKLQGARRIVSEWPALDEEARSFTSQVQPERFSTVLSHLCFLCCCCCCCCHKLLGVYDTWQAPSAQGQ